MQSATCTGHVHTHARVLVRACVCVRTRRAGTKRPAGSQRRTGMCGKTQNNPCAYMRKGGGSFLVSTVVLGSSSLQRDKMLIYNNDNTDWVFRSSVL